MRAGAAVCCNATGRVRLQPSSRHCVSIPADYPSQLMLERTRALMKAPPGDDWDGVWSTSDAA